jgi:hypothetical protein
MLSNDTAEGLLDAARAVLKALEIIERRKGKQLWLDASLAERRLLSSVTRLKLLKLVCGQNAEFGVRGGLFPERGLVPCLCHLLGAVATLGEQLANPTLSRP